MGVERQYPHNITTVINYKILLEYHMSHSHQSNQTTVNILILLNIY